MSVERFVHPQPGPTPRLAALAFLVGELRGQGWYGQRRSRVEKRVHGYRAAGGRHIVLDMTTDHVLEDGRIDRHAALVVISEAGDTLHARAYTDSGGFIDYTLNATAGGLTFSDPVPHDSDAASARKLLLGTAAGYQEILEIERADGSRTRHCEIKLERA